MSFFGFLFSLSVLIAVCIFLMYLCSESYNKGFSEYKEKLFKRSLEKDYIILELEKGFEKYYLKVEIIPKENVYKKQYAMGSVLQIREEYKMSSTSKTEEVK